MPLPIPKRYRAGILNIVELSDKEIELLIEALKNASRSPDIAEITKSVSSTIPSIELNKLTEIVKALYSISHVREFSGVGFSRFLDDLVESIAEIVGSPDDIEGIEYISSLRDKFEKLLNVETLRIISKAARLQSDGEYLYCSSKILSDIRPVFNEDPDTRPAGAVITHTLKIVYHAGANVEEFHIVLDSHELDELKEVINRACSKEKTIRELMKEANLTNLGA
jgi:hypothetical protein